MALKRTNKRPTFIFHTSLVLLLLSVACVSTQSLSHLTTTNGSPSSNPPFGLPPSSFLADAIASPYAISNASFPATGYNTSIPAGPVDATGDGIPGWSLEISVAANVPLTNASSDASGSGISADDRKNKVIEAAVLSLSPPAGLGAGLDDGDSWRVCAIVFAGGLSERKTEEAQAKGQAGEKGLDGTCAALLPSECVQELQVNSVANNTDRGGGGDSCGRLVVPDTCAEYFGGTTEGMVGIGYGKFPLVSIHTVHASLPSGPWSID